MHFLDQKVKFHASEVVTCLSTERTCSVTESSCHLQHVLLSNVYRRTNSHTLLQQTFEISMLWQLLPTFILYQPHLTGVFGPG